MHLLYLDDSGNVNNEDEEYLVLGGISVYEAQAPWVSQELDKQAEALHDSDPNAIEFHASEIFQGRTEPWKSMARLDRVAIVNNVLSILQRSYDTATIFACAIHKPSYAKQDAMEMAFEDLCSRFSRYLQRISVGDRRERGLIVLDESSYETSLQKLALDFRTLGTRWGVIQNLVETPLFVDSKASRCIQLADHIAYSTFRRYESGDTQFFDTIVNKFDQDQGILHGLAHKQTANPECMCPACLTRRQS